jgi:serine/threonine protein kinase
VEEVTLWYRAPEILMGLVNYGRSADIWSLGCILGEMAGGQAMFPARSTTEACTSIFGF